MQSAVTALPEIDPTYGATNEGQAPLLPCGHTHVEDAQATLADPGVNAHPTAVQMTGLAMSEARRRPTSHVPPVTFLPLARSTVVGVVVQLIQYPRFASSSAPSGDLDRSHTYALVTEWRV